MGPVDSDCLVSHVDLMLFASSLDRAPEHSTKTTIRTAVLILAVPALSLFAALIVLVMAVLEQSVQGVLDSRPGSDTISVRQRNEDFARHGMSEQT